MLKVICTDSTKTDDKYQNKQMFNLHTQSKIPHSE